jgi:hypothetical protein
MKGKIVQTKITNQLRTPYSNLGIHEIEHNVYIHFIDDLFASFTTCSKKGTNRRTRKQGAELTERDRERQPRGVVVRELLWFGPRQQPTTTQLAIACRSKQVVFCLKAGR